MPLVFIEVKKPNNRDGILAERNRINTRFRNPKFRRFVNITQLMVFSNNMEYDDGSPEPLEGAFYASPSYEEPSFNYFREEEKRDLSQLLAAGGPGNRRPHPRGQQPHQHQALAGVCDQQEPGHARPTASAPRCSPATASLSCCDLPSPTSRPTKAWRNTSCATRRSSPPRRSGANSKPASARASSGTPRAAAKPRWPITTSITSPTGSRNRASSRSSTSSWIASICSIQASREFRSRGLVVHTINSREAFAQRHQVHQRHPQRLRHARNHRRQYPEIPGRPGCRPRHRLRPHAPARLFPR